MEIKDRHAKESSFSRALLAGLICGIISRRTDCVLDNFEYRKLAGFKGFNFIEPLLDLHCSSTATGPCRICFFGNG